MTIKEFTEIRELIEARFRKDMAGVGAGVVHDSWSQSPGESDRVGSGTGSGEQQPVATRPPEPLPGPTGFLKKTRAEVKAMSSQERKEYKVSYMRDYASRKRQGLK